MQKYREFYGFSPIKLYPSPKNASDSAGLDSQFPKSPIREFTHRNREEIAAIREFARPSRENPFDRSFRRAAGWRRDCPFGFRECLGHRLVASLAADPIKARIACVADPEAARLPGIPGTRKANPAPRPDRYHQCFLFDVTPGRRNCRYFDTAM
jgi:hypothetical protein